MRLALHTVICCCVLTTVLPLVKGATGELNCSQKKRFKVKQSGLKGDPGKISATANEQYSDVHVGPQKGMNAKTVSQPLSFGFNIRPRRSPSSKTSGCVLVTCAYHDLLDRLHKFSTQDLVNAPEEKISSKGYGRRRRHTILDATEHALQTGRQRRSTEAAQQICTHTVA